MRFLAILIALFPAAAFAEGNRQHFTCSVDQTCDGLGACAPSGEQWAFTIEPIEVGPQGEGLYHMVYGDTVTQAALRTDFTMIWTDEEWTMQEFIFTGSKTALRIRRDLSSPPVTEVGFLTCEGPT